MRAAGGRFRLVKAAKQFYLTMASDGGAYELLVCLTEIQSKSHAPITDRMVAIADTLDLSFEAMQARSLEERTKICAEG